MKRFRNLVLLNINFIERGYLEKHINRMRNYYRTLRDTILTCIRKHPLYKNVKIMEENSGLHFLLHIKTDLTDSVLNKNILSKNINISCLSEYYYGNNDDSHTLVVNYSGLDINVAEEAIERLYSGIFM